MKITINLFATFRAGRFDKEERDCLEGATLRHVVDEVGIKVDDIGMSLVNGCHATLERRLVEGDCVYLFPLLGGG
jgi:molybdopterin converting factor small subunit